MRSPTGNTQQRRQLRERIVVIAFATVLLAIAGRLVQLQIIEPGRWRALAQKQMYNRAHDSMPRGEIRDRSGLPLAVSLPLSYAIGFRGNPTIDRDELAQALGDYLPYSTEAIRSKLDKDGYRYVARRVDWQVKQELESRDLSGIEFVKEARRSYPATTAAGTVLGFTNVDEKGMEGIEWSLDSLLRGDEREMLVWNDAKRAVPAVMSAPDESGAFPGANVHLTIDLQLQAIVDRCLVDGLKDRDFEKACAVLMDPRTGEVLAISTLPLFDPNAPNDTPKEYWKCWAVTDMFEPGSIFKIVTVGAGLEEGVVTPSTVINCEGGAYAVPGKVLHDAHAYGELTVSDVFAKSSNIGCAKIAERLRAETHYSWIYRFGFGTKTDIGILPDPAGIVPKPAIWSGPTRSNLAIGQGVTVTAIQIASAYSAIANGGMLMQPKLIRGLDFPTGEHVQFDPVALHPVLSPEHAQELTRMLQRVVEDGTGKAAAIKGVAIAGKTGTAQKVNHVQGGYYANRYISSFAGFFPADDPKYVLLVVVDDPRGAGYYGGQISAPVFGAIARDILEARHAGLLPVEETPDSVAVDSSAKGSEPDSSEREKFTYDSLRYADVPLAVVPNVIGLPLRMAAERMKNMGFEPQLLGNGIVVSQFPEAGARIPQSIVCQVTAQPAGAQYAASR